MASRPGALSSGPFEEIYVAARIFDKSLDLTMLIQVNEWSETVEFWRKKVEDLEAAGKETKTLKTKLNQGIKKALKE